MTVDPLASLLIGALGASLIALVGGLVGAVIQARREHRRWVREERFTAYRDFLQSIDSARIDTAKKSVLSPEHLNSMHRVIGTIRLVGPTAMYESARSYHLAAITLNTLQKMAAANDWQDNASMQVVEAGEKLDAAADVFAAAGRRVLGIRA